MALATVQRRTIEQLRVRPDNPLLELELRQILDQMRRLLD
jgi:hypothetical protein